MEVLTLSKVYAQLECKRDVYRNIMESYVRLEKKKGFDFSYLNFLNSHFPISENERDFFLSKPFAAFDDMSQLWCENLKRRSFDEESVPSWVASISVENDVCSDVGLDKLLVNATWIFFSGYCMVDEKFSYESDLDAFELAVIGRFLLDIDNLRLKFSIDDSVVKMLMSFFSGPICLSSIYVSEKCCLDYLDSAISQVLMCMQSHQPVLCEVLDHAVSNVCYFPDEDSVYDDEDYFEESMLLTNVLNPVDASFGVVEYVKDVEVTQSPSPVEEGQTVCRLHWDALFESTFSVSSVMCDVLPSVFAYLGPNKLFQCRLVSKEWYVSACRSVYFDYTFRPDMNSDWSEAMPCVRYMISSYFTKISLDLLNSCVKILVYLRGSIENLIQFLAHADNGDFLSNNSLRYFVYCVVHALGIRDSCYLLVGIREYEIVFRNKSFLRYFYYKKFLPMKFLPASRRTRTFGLSTFARNEVYYMFRDFCRFRNVAGRYKLPRVVCDRPVIGRIRYRKSFNDVD